MTVDIAWVPSVDNANLADYPYGTAPPAGTIVGGSGCLNDSSDSTYLYTTGVQQVTARITPMSPVPAGYTVTGWGFSVRYKMAGPWPGGDPRGIAFEIQDPSTILNSSLIYGNFSTSIVTNTFDRTDVAGDGVYFTSDHQSDLWLLFQTGTVSGYGDTSLWVYELTVTAHYEPSTPPPLTWRNRGGDGLGLYGTGRWRSRGETAQSNSGRWFPRY